jgi:hypothetical protein
VRVEILQGFEETEGKSATSVLPIILFCVACKVISKKLIFFGNIL